MSVNILDRVEQKVSDESLLTGYTVRKFRWTDEDVQGDTPIILFRVVGSGGSDEFSQSNDVRVMLLEADESKVVQGSNRIWAIMKAFRDSDYVTGVTRFDPVSTVSGPLYLDNGRPMWYFDVRVYTVDQ